MLEDDFFKAEFDEKIHDLCNENNEFVQNNLHQKMYTQNNEEFNFIRCARKNFDGHFNYIILDTGLKLYHGSPGVTAAIREGTDPVFPLGLQSGMEETWYSSHDIARRYGDTDEILVFEVKEPAKMLVLNDLWNLKRMFRAFYIAFPGKLTSEQQQLQEDFAKFLHEAVWIQTGKGGELLNWQEHGESKFIKKDVDINAVAIDRHGSRWLEQEFAGFLCGWLQKYGYAGYISDVVHSTDPRLCLQGGNCEFHPEVVFCYAPQYLQRLSGAYGNLDSRDTRFWNNELQAPRDYKMYETLAPQDYIDFYKSIENNESIDPQIKEKWRMVVQGIKMQAFSLRSENLRLNQYTQLCNKGDHHLVDIYAFVEENHGELSIIPGLIQAGFPATIEEFKAVLQTTKDVIGYLTGLCNLINFYSPKAQMPNGKQTKYGKDSAYKFAINDLKTYSSDIVTALAKELEIPTNSNMHEKIVNHLLHGYFN
jgi:hypothetical protein